MKALRAWWAWFRRRDAAEVPATRDPDAAQREEYRQRGARAQLRIDTLRARSYPEPHSPNRRSDDPR